MKKLLNMYFSFSGRLNRYRYFIYSLPLGIILLVAYLASLAVNTYTSLGIFMLIAVVCSISGASLSVRRLHDLDRAGWWVLINLLSSIPILKIIACIFDFYLLFAPGTKGSNQYGEDLLQS